MKSLNIMVVAALAAFSVTAAAQTVLIRGATVHTMTAEGALENTDVLIEAGKIREIGNELPVPQDDVYVFDAGGRPLTPALFAGISSIGIGEVSAVDESVDDTLALKDMHPEFDVAPAYNPNSSLVAVTRIEGFGFTLLGAESGGSIFGGLGHLVSLDGGFGSFFGGPVLFINIGRDTSSLSGDSRAGQWMLLDQAMNEADRPPVSTDAALLTRAGRGTLTLFSDGGKVVFHVDRASDILQTLKFAGNYGLDIAIAGGAEAWMVAQQLAAAGVPVLLDPLVNLPGNFDRLGARMDNAAILHAAGVTVAISGGEAHNARKQRQLAGNAVANGLPFDAGLAALTSNPARIFGVEDQQGYIRAGQPANVVLWSGDPLEVTSAADIVILDGRPVPMESRQTRLRDRYLPQNPEMPRAYIKP